MNEHCKLFDLIKNTDTLYTDMIFGKKDSSTKKSKKVISKRIKNNKNKKHIVK